MEEYVTPYFFFQNSLRQIRGFIDKTICIAIVLPYDMKE